MISAQQICCWGFFSADTWMSSLLVFFLLCFIFKSTSYLVSPSYSYSLKHTKVCSSQFKHVSEQARAFIKWLSQTHLRSNEDIMSQNKTRRIHYERMTAFHPLLINPDSLPVERLLLRIPYVLKPLIKRRVACLHHVLLIRSYKYCTYALGGTVCNRKSVGAFQVAKLSAGNLFWTEVWRKAVLFFIFFLNYIALLVHFFNSPRKTWR